MRIPDLVAYAIKSLRHRSLRSWLTILGIVIGIAAIVILISLAQGLDTSIKNQLSILGTNYAVILPGNVFQSGFRFGPPILKGILYTRDVELIENVAGVETASGNIAIPLTSVEFKGENITSSVAGVNVETYKRYITSGLEEGKFFVDGDPNGAVIGHGVAHDSFNKDMQVGDTLVIREKAFKVRGIINKVGATGGNFDQLILIDHRAARAILKEKEESRVTSILAVTRQGSDVKPIAEEIKSTLRNSHKVKEGEEDFTVLTAESVSEQIGQITGILSLFLGGVAAISLVVGGIGVANAMFTSVLERTREIGILKALGASQKAILQLFLLESGIIGAVGGILGVLLAIGVSRLLNYFGVPSIVSWELMAFALLFSFGVGVVSGLVPARNASKLEPVEALRYE